jgi:1-deoxyxylulose-5-phosphate synthase
VQYVNVGSSGLLVSKVVVGTARFGETDDSDVDKIVGTALDLGITAFDTADIYVGGRSEELLGRAVASRRDQLVICSKVGMRVGDTEADHGTAFRGMLDHAARWHRGIAPTDQGLSRKHVFSALDASLRRLGTDYIDLYQVHCWDPRTPIGETIGALDDAVRAGKIRYVGCSGFAAWQVYRGLWESEVRGLVRFHSLQAPYNVLNSAAQQELLTACAHENVGVLAFQMLAGGMLSDRYALDSSEPAAGSRLATRASYRRTFWTEDVFTTVKALHEVAKSTGRAVSQLALGRVFANPAIAAGLFGASRPEQLRDAVDVIDRPLTSEEIAAVDDAVAPRPEAKS